MYSLIGISAAVVGQPIKYKPETFCAYCAQCFLPYMLWHGGFYKKVDSIALGILQLGFAGVFSIVFHFYGDREASRHSSILGSTLALSILCTAFGYVVQAAAQKHTSDSCWADIFLEPVFSAICGFIFGRTPSCKRICGCRHTFAQCPDS